MSKLHDPELVRLDLRMFFEQPNQPRRPRIGVVTKIAYSENRDELLVTAGAGDSGLHDTLADQVQLGSSKVMELPSEMYSRFGLVTGWYYPDIENQLGAIAGQIDSEYKSEAVLTREQTDRHLRMAALALGSILLLEPRQVLEFRNPGNLVVGRPLLKKSEKRFGKSIYSS